MSDDEYYGALPVGHELHEYVVDGVLGQGGFGITYLAHDKNLRKTVAVKEYLPETFAVRHDALNVTPKSSSKEDFEWGLTRFLQEAQTLGQFEHPNIVPVMRFFRANGTAYMVMNYQDGRSLRAILDESDQLEEAELQNILYPLLDGLNRVHNEGVLHRDIKPGNIFIRIDGSPVLLDFGAARQAIGERVKNVTRIVTPNYAPHEQYYTDGHLGPWTDIYALAAVIYEGISGAPPPEAPARIVKDRITPAVELGDGQYHQDFLEAIDWALAVNLEDRPQNVAEWCEKLPPGTNGPPVLESHWGTAAAAAWQKADRARPGPNGAGGHAERRRERRTGSTSPLDPTAATRTAPTLLPNGSPSSVQRAGQMRMAGMTGVPGNGDTLPATARGSHRLKWAAGALVVLLMSGFGVLAVQFLATTSPPRAALADVRDVAQLAEDGMLEEAFRASLRVVKAKPKSKHNAKLRAMFAGATVYARHHNKSGLVQWNFKPGGLLVGAYNTNMDDPNANDTGVWRIQGDRLCMKWNKWYGRRMACYVLKIGGSGNSRTLSTSTWRGKLKK